MNVKEVLLNSYPKANEVQDIIVNGELKGYFVKSKTGDAMYVPASVVSGKNVDMMSYIPGAGGAKNDAAAIVSKINTNPPDYVISIAQSCGDGNNSMENCYNTLQRMNLNVEKNVTVCFSAGGDNGLANTNAFLKNHSNVSCSVVVCEPAKEIKNLVSSSTALSSLQSNNVPIYFVGPDNWNSRNFNYRSLIQKMKEMGFNTYHLQTNYTSSREHVLNNQDVLSGNLVECLLGYEDTFNTDPTKNKPGYRLYQYDPNKKEFVNVPFSNMVGSLNGVIEIPDLDVLKTVDHFQVTKTENPLLKEYGYLGNLGDLKIDSPTVISSDYNYLANSVNDIRGNISKTSFLNGLDSVDVRVGSTLLAIINKYLNMYYDTVGKLLESLTMETEAIISYGQAMVDMDNSISKDANLIEDVPIEDTPVVSPDIIDETDTVLDISDDVVDDGDNSNEDTSYEHTGGRYTGGNSNTGGSRDTDGGSNNSSFVGNNGNDTNTANNNVNTVNNISNDVSSSLEEPSYVVKMDDCNVLIYTKDGMVSDMMYQYTFDTALNAQNNYDILLKKYSSLDYIKEIVIKDNYINIIFKQSFYNNQTAKQIIDTYFSGGVVNG